MKTSVMNPVRPCLDFHFHSVYSNDAFGIPGEYVARAERCGVTAIAPAEHDNVDSLPRYREAIETQRAPLALYAGVEIDVASPRWGHFHMLAYFFDPEDRELRAVLDNEVAGGFRQLDAVIQKMNEDGQGMDREAAFAHYRRNVPDRAVGPKAILTWLHESGRQPSFEAAKAYYNDYAQQVPVQHTPSDFEQVMRIVHDAGGLAVLAHPAERFVEADLVEMMKRGLDGVEVYTPSNRDRAAEWEAVARRREWTMTGGSDNHQATGGDFNAWPTAASARLLEALFTAYEKRHGRAPQALHPGVSG